MAAFAVDGKRRRNARPWWWLRLLLNPASHGFQAADFVKLHGLKARIGDWHRFTRDRVPCTELMLGVGPLSYADQELSRLVTNAAAYLKRVAKIGVATLIERASQSNPWLN